MYMDTIKCLSKLPADDGNFKSALSSATENQIRLALEVMRKSNGQNKSRIKACERELRKRDRKNNNQ